MPRSPRAFVPLALLLAACAGGPRQQAAALGAPDPAPAPAPTPAPALVADARVDEPDTDADQIHDPDDRCPTQAETYNGFQDTDGCPDEVPTQLARFTSGLRGVAFGGPTGSAPIPPSAGSEALEWVQGALPAMSAEKYAHRTDNQFIAVADDPRSTFSIDVDTASYANVRRFLEAGQRPPADAVRIEEMINYFTYDYPAPTGDDAFAVHAEVAECPWNPTHRLVKLGIKGKLPAPERLPPKNLVFLIDVSGSMADPNKLPLLRSSLLRFVDTLTARDRVAIVVYADAAGVVLPSTAGDDKQLIRAAIARLGAAGSTAGGQGIRAAYELAAANFLAGGVNRVLLATDGDFNVGETSESALVRLIEDRRKTGVFLTVLGFGTGNLGDATMELLADKGNGNYAYIDTPAEADKVLIREAAGTLVTIAKDVKLQVEFNPARVGAYRLIGYENRVLAHRDFKDDRKDAGEIGAGHTVTAFYEIAPKGHVRPDSPAPAPLKYQSTPTRTAAAASDELLTVAIRHKRPDGEASREQTLAVRDPGRRPFTAASEDFRFAAAVAEFGLLLRDAPRRGSAGADHVLAVARAALGADPHGDRRGLVGLVERWKELPQLERARRSEEAEHRRAYQHSLAEARKAEAKALAAERRSRGLSPARALAEAGALPRGAAKAIAHTAEILRAYPTVRVEISGHADNQEGGTPEMRLGLSRARAEAVRKYLVEREGIDPARLELRAAGSDEPVDTNETVLGRARNRRTEFTILTQ
jgi:Ca-activated chloride channel family protein